MTFRPFLLSIGFIAILTVQAAPAWSIVPAARASGPVEELTIDGIITMVQAGLGEELIIARIRKENRSFDLSPNDMIRLKKAGATEAMLKVMLEPKGDAAKPASSTTGAPAPATAPASDPNDPAAPHDSGIYLVTKDRQGAPTMIVLERAAYQGAKTGGLFAASMTMGLKKAKTKAVLPGSKASIRTSDTHPVFYFYFEDKAAGLGKGYFGSNLSSPNQFALLKLEAKKSNRETTIGEVGAFGASSGTDSKAMVGFRSERIRPGVYKITTNQSLEPGEYCFLASAGFGAFGAGAAGAVEIFDFAISIE